VVAALQPVHLLVPAFFEPSSAVPSLAVGRKRAQLVAVAIVVLSKDDPDPRRLDHRRTRTARPRRRRARCRSRRGLLHEAHREPRRSPRGSVGD
jgi:hypothetical protein